MATEPRLVVGTDDADFARVARAIVKAKRIAVLCGAGISCGAGIPDFRSSEGLFRSLKDRNPRAGLASGKDLFTASLFQSEASTALFYQMIAELRAMSDAAQPTAFHRFLKSLDDQGKLLRVYTQNIDGLEAKAGLSYGLDAVDKAPKQVAGVKRKRDGDAIEPPTPPDTAPSDSYASHESSPPPSSQLSSSLSSLSGDSSMEQQLPTPPPSFASKRTPATAAACRVIPLHGSMSTMTCHKCHQTEPLEGEYLASLAQGQPVACPFCSRTEEAREAMAERSRGVGVMRVDVVLYGEEHVAALRIGEITHRDLMGPRPDLFLVVGTSLKVPGTKRLVRELAKVVRSVEPKPEDVRSVYINLEYPKPASEFKGVFDVFLQGDVQELTKGIEVYAVEEAERQAKREVELAQRKAKRLEREANGEVVPARKPAKGKSAKKVKAPPRPREPKPPPPPRVKPSHITVVETVPWNIFRIEQPPLARTRMRQLVEPAPSGGGAQTGVPFSTHHPVHPARAVVPQSAPATMTTFFAANRPGISSVAKPGPSHA